MSGKIPGRVRFGDTAGERAPFPSAIVVFRPAALREAA
jgi:hypothetical protein